ncbi:hypothetical protein [Amycolatopsis sp. cmx-11-32]|uniref:hypothetical protein n=1 Tax=Amycolatopsis sp. cmx-11-32 TaxID=2785796 RepID=UPI0039E2C80C
MDRSPEALPHGPQATVLVFGDGPTLEGARRILPEGSALSDGDFEDVGGHAFAAYEAENGRQVQIRPDGYIRGLTA